MGSNPTVTAIFVSIDVLFKVIPDCKDVGALLLVLGKTLPDSFLIAVVGIAILVGLLFWLRRNKKHHALKSNRNQPVNGLAGMETQSSDLALYDFPLTFENLVKSPDRSKLIELKDRSLISRLDAVIPGALDVAGKIANKLPDNAVLIDIPLKDLAASKALEGAKRAFKLGKNGIAQNANLTQIDPDKLAQLANLGSGVMNIAALVVGQQMMSEINSKLSAISDGIDSLQSIAMAELKSKIMADVAITAETANSQVEIIENSELRQSKFSTVDDLKRSSAQLLGQVNQMIDDVSTKPTFQHGSRGFKAYEQEVQKLDEFVTWQTILLSLLEQQSRLAHALSLGALSLGKTHATLRIYSEATQQVNQRLHDWHDEQIKSLQIAVDDRRAAKGVLWRAPGLINEKWKYLHVQDGLVSSIEQQRKLTNVFSTSQTDSFESDVQLVMLDGEYFYSPKDNNE